MSLTDWLDNLLISLGLKSQPTQPKKLFRVESSQEQPNINISTTPQSSGAFTIHAKTRPKQCPLCRAENKIVRLLSDEWNCEECGYTWKS